MANDSDEKTGELAPGALLGKYRIVRLLGTGGMGSVYEAVHTGIGKVMAIKTMRGQGAADAHAEQRFLREAASASRLNHPHVVDVVDFGTENGTAYLVMELLRGEDLAASLARSPSGLQVSTTCDLMIPVCAAVFASHQHGVVHRDLKPQNIFLSRTAVGEVVPKVLDFGVSKLLDDQAGPGLTAAGAVMGTPNYLSPEQVLGLAVDGRSDMYALGVILYECLTGRRPHDGSSMFVIMRAITDGRFSPPRSLRPDLPGELERIILQAMALRRQDRFASVHALGQALLPFASAKSRLMWVDYFEGMSAPATPFAVPDLPATSVSPLARTRPLPISSTARPTVRRAGVLALAVAVIALAALGLRQVLLRERTPASDQASPQAAVPRPTAPAVASSDLRCLDDIRDDCPFLNPSPAVLKERARCGTLLFDRPNFETAAERAAGPPLRSDLDQTRRRAEDRLAAALAKELRALHQELAGSPFRRDSSLRELIATVQSLASRAGDVHRKLAEERAGLRPVPGAGEVAAASPTERFWRLRVGVGDRYQDELAQDLGPSEARALREKFNGWETKEVLRGDCPAPAALQPAEPPPLNRTLAGLDDDTDLTGRRLEGKATCATDGCGFLHPSLEQRAERARCGVVRFDLPKLLGRNPDQANNDWPALTPGEARTLTALSRSFSTQIRSELAAFYRQLNGRPAPSKLSWRQLRDRTEELLPSSKLAPTLRLIALEQAGQREPPDPERLRGMPVPERYWRFLVGLGDRYEQLLAEVVGKTRARKQREKLDGWSLKETFEGACLTQP